VHGCPLPPNTTEMGGLAASFVPRPKGDPFDAATIRKAPNRVPHATRFANRHRRSSGCPSAATLPFVLAVPSNWRC